MQFKQLVTEDAAISELHWPAAHCVQVAAPDSDHVPAIHDEHKATLFKPMFIEAVPALHEIQVELEAAPTVLDHVPALQLEQDSPLSSQDPAVQDAVHMVAPAAENDPGVHAIQVPSEVAAIAAEKVPLLHVVQAADPRTDHVPALHCKQAAIMDAPAALDHNPAEHV